MLFYIIVNTKYVRLKYEEIMIASQVYFPFLPFFIVT